MHGKLCDYRGFACLTAFSISNASHSIHWSPFRYFWSQKSYEMRQLCSFVLDLVWFNQFLNIKTYVAVQYILSINILKRLPF